MVRVVASADLRRFTGGLEAFDVEADTVRRLVKALEARFPGLGDYVDRRMAIAIDGEIHQDAWTSPLKPDSEVYFIPKIGGG
jgi:molybdopterin converting factor small subunit